MATNKIPMVSVVIPIYRVEEYLNTCVRGVLDQTYRDIEVILVDDGSPDGCPDMADAFAKEDSRVVVIHQENRGLSGARNAGLARARGHLVVFLDSDDFWSGADSLAKCVAASEAAGYPDVLFFDHVSHFPGGGRRTFSSEHWDINYIGGPSEKTFAYLVQIGDLRPSACTKILRRDFLLANNLFFKSRILSEDIEWFLRLSLCKPTYSHIPLGMYQYRSSRPGSITSTIGRNNIEDLLETLSASTERVDAAITSQEFREAYLSYCGYQYLIALAFYGGFDWENRRALRPKIRSLAGLLDFQVHPKVRRISFLKRFIGVGATSRALHFFLKARSGVRRQPHLIRG